jgi:cytochrome c553
MKVPSILLLGSVLGIVAGICASALSLADGSAEEGKEKVTACIACHGATGASPNPEWPNLAGQHESYIKRQLQAFKSGARKNPLMTPMAMGLSDDDMDDLAAYYSQQTPTGLEADAAKVSLGQRLYRGGDPRLGTAACGACHGPGGDGNPAAGYPAINGQHAVYIAAQLRAYRSGARQTDANQMMRTVASTMTDEQIDAVASYVQGLR